MKHPRIVILIAALAALSLTGCKDKTANTTATPEDNDTTEVVKRTEATSDTHKYATSGTTINKQWVSDNEDGTTHMIDLTSDMHYVEALTFPEELCRKKAKVGLKANTFYYIKQAPKYKVLLNKDNDETSGDVSFIVMDGADNNDYQFRFAFSNLTSKEVTITFEDGSSYVYKALDKPVQVETAPKFQDQPLY